jgi:hypothetical protein
MFLPDRYIKGECPVCHTKDQYGDSCENCSSVYAPTDLIDPYSTLSGVAPVRKSSDHYFFRLSDPKCVEFMRGWLDAPGTAAAVGREQGARMDQRQRRSGARRLGHLARRALLRHPDSGRARQILLRVAGRADRLSRLAQELLRQRQGARQRRAAQLR